MKSVLLALAFATAATAAIAQVPSPDTNHDGRVTLPEYQAFSWARWLERADTNHDGRISKAEVSVVAGARAPMLGLFWGRMDTNHNDVLDRAEVDAMSLNGFHRADTNHDGVVDAAEMAAARARQR
jgi:5-hydroxyisourate hydrolase-like protein (transthyretin family)